MTADSSPAMMDPAQALIARGLAFGIITPEQAERLSALAAAPEGAAVPSVDLPPPDEERLRFVTGFADIFVTMGLFLFLGAASYLSGLPFGPPGAYAVTAVLAWLLAEFFSRRRRMALPSIVLLAIFVYSAFVGVAASLGDWQPSIFGYLFGRTYGGVDLIVVAAAAAVTLALAALHYWRFRVPITIAAGMAALIATLVALALSFLPEAGGMTLHLLLVIAGLATFALAMHFDLSDPERVTRRADIAFWMHLLAAPLIVHPVMNSIVKNGPIPPGAAAAVLAVVLLLSIVALVTDRRAILVSGLLYAGIAVGSIVQNIGFDTVTVPLTLLALGAFVLLLSAGWQPLRRLVLRPLPRAIRQRLPHPVGL